MDNYRAASLALDSTLAFFSNHITLLIHLAVTIDKIFYTLMNDNNYHWCLSQFSVAIIKVLRLDTYKVKRFIYLAVLEVQEYGTGCC